MSYPNHHYGAEPIKFKHGWKCSGCGFIPLEPTNIGAVKTHIKNKQKWEAKWQKCPKCSGTGKIPKKRFDEEFLKGLSDMELIVLQKELRQFPEDESYLHQVLKEIGRRQKA